MFNKQAATFTLGTVTAATPDDVPTQSPFGGIIGGFNTLSIHKGRQRLLHFENILAGATGFAVVQQGANFQQADDFKTNGLHRRLEIDPGEGSVTDTIYQRPKLLKTGQKTCPITACTEAGVFSQSSGEMGNSGGKFMLSVYFLSGRF